MEELPYWAIIALIVVAIGFGLWVGNRAGKLLPADEDDKKKKKTLGARARGAVTSGIIKLWKWNRVRGKDKD